MIEFVLTADELDVEEFEAFPATYIGLKENGDISIDFEQLDPDDYNNSCVGITDNLKAREHEDDYDSREENWVLSYEPKLTE